MIHLNKRTGKRRRMVARFCARRFLRAMWAIPGKWLIRCQGASRASRSPMTEASTLNECCFGVAK